MKKRNRVTKLPPFPLLFASTLLFFLSPGTPAQEVTKGGIDNKEAAVRFCAILQQAVKSEQKTKIAALVGFYPIQVEFNVRSYPLKQIVGRKSILITDEKDFIENFSTVFNEDVSRALSSNSACELETNKDGSARIANGQIGIDQTEDGATTFITWISPPKDYEAFYKDVGALKIGAENFLKELQQAVSSNDKLAVAKLCSYPLRVNFANRQSTVKDRAQLITSYAAVFTPKVKEAVLAAGKPELVGWRGFMLHDGELWLDLVVGTSVFRVTAINVP